LVDGATAVEQPAEMWEEKEKERARKLSPIHGGFNVAAGGSEGLGGLFC
jgi:hypothetical protein